MKLLASTLATVAFGYAADELCPSNFDGTDANSGCYTQVGTWNADTNNADQISCNMSNPACLVVECSGTKMKATLRYDLFQINEKHATPFGAQLQAGTRELVYNDKVLSEGGSCGYSVDHASETVTLDWDYTACQMSPTIDEATDELVFTMALSSPGNAPGIEDIEFYVDTDVTAQCKYPTKIMLEHAFWVNQEDTDVNGDNTGVFNSLFACEFFNDASYEQEIGDKNIVNMGKPIYGKARALLEMPGLKYTLTGVVVSDASTPPQVTGADGEAKSFNVIGPVEDDKVKMSDDVEAKWENQSTGSAPTEPGADIDFSYLSFGFEDLGHQNKLKVQCDIKVEKGCDVKNAFRIHYKSDSISIHEDATGDLPDVYFNDFNPSSLKISGGELQHESQYSTDYVEFSPCDPVTVMLKASSGDAVLLEKMEVEVCDRRACAAGDSLDDCPGNCNTVDVLPAKSAIIDEPTEHASFWFDALDVNDNNKDHCHKTTYSAKDICGFTAYSLHKLTPDGEKGGDRICHTEAHFELSLALMDASVAPLTRDLPACTLESQTWTP